MSKRADRSPRRRDKPSSHTAPAAAPSPSPLPGVKDAGSAGDRLAALLDGPHLARIVPHLAPEVVHQVIRHRGLEACGAMIAASTPQQLASVLDLDLWHATSGSRDRFDAHRFGSWIETLMEEGEEVAARVMTTMDEELAIAGLSCYVRVLDPGVFIPAFSSDDELEPYQNSRSEDLESDIGGYIVRGKTADAWDAITGLLVNLADHRPQFFHTLMEGCRRLSNSTPERDGLDDLLLAPDQALHDISLSREHRRTNQGYLTAGDARAFLRMARHQHALESPASSVNPIAAAYFRALDEAQEAVEPPTGQEHQTRAQPGDDGSPPEDIAALLVEAGITPARPRALLGPLQEDVLNVLRVHALMEYVHDHNQIAYFARTRELGFLSNALVSGASVYSRALTPQEAWDAALGVCNIGLEVWSDRLGRREGADAAVLPDAFLLDHDLITMFQAGWMTLHNDVSMFVAEQLIAVLAQVHVVDSETQRDVYLLRRELQDHCRAGTPWRAQTALEVLAILDTPAWACLCALLSECPVLPATLTAILDRRAASIDVTAFECFSKTDQIQKVHEFAARLTDMLQ